MVATKKNITIVQNNTRRSMSKQYVCRPKQFDCSFKWRREKRTNDTENRQKKKKKRIWLEWWHHGNDWLFTRIWRLIWIVNPILAACVQPLNRNIVSLIKKQKAFFYFFFFLSAWIVICDVLVDLNRWNRLCCAPIEAVNSSISNWKKRE